jgi:cell wall-associated NlpC family hydrolase
MMRRHLPILAAGSALVLAACGMLATAPETPPAKSAGAARLPGKADEVVMFALGLVESRYRFGGKNPEAGFDCSGMVSYVFDKAAGLRLAGPAADMARRGRPVMAADLKPGDLVFFNTLDRPHSHVGIYVGDGRFVHAPSSRGSARIRLDSLRSGWYASRFEEARSYLD